MYHLRFLFAFVIAASGKFPDNLAAIKRIKAAFSIRIADELRKQFNLLARSNLNSVDLIKGKHFLFIFVYIHYLLMH